MTLPTLERRDFGKIVEGSAGPAGLRDQADGVRRLAGPATAPARVIAVTSGKGGVGKTNLAVNLSIALATLYRRTVLVDLDLGLANADILFDMNPRHTLADVVAGRRTLGEVSVPVGNFLKVIPGASGMATLANLAEADRRTLVSAVEEACRGAQFVILDTGAGISRAVTSFLAAADEVLVVTTPEPTAVVDAYAVIKLLSMEASRGEIGLVMNMVRSAEEADRFAHGIASTAAKLLGAYVGRRGHVVQDPLLVEAVRRRRPVYLDDPQAPSSRGIRSIAEAVAGTRSEREGGFFSRLFSRIGM